MWRRWRALWGHWLASGGYLALALTGAHAARLHVWQPVVGLVAALALFAWLVTRQRLRAMGDTPTSRIASAAQGYVELRGLGKAMGGTPLLSPLTHLPCLWYRYKTERRQGDRWIEEERGTSDASFLIDDGSGECLIDPEGADITPRRRDTWQADGRRYTESVLLPGETLYAIGEFRTQGGMDLALDARADIAALINDWKNDMPALARRYDRNGDGTLDLDEWEQVRRDARAEVEQRHAQLRAAPDTHRLVLPADGRPFLVSAQASERFERQLRWWAWAHAGVFLLALGVLGWAHAH